MGHIADISTALATEIEGVEAVLLYGSVARGTAGDDSDIDLLVVTQRPMSGRGVKARLVKRSPVAQRLSVSCRTWEGAAGLARDDWSFAAHLLREGHTLWDQEGRLEGALSYARPRRGELSEQYDSLTARLNRFDDLSPYLGHHLFVLAEVFRVGKAIAMLACAQAETFEYDRRRAFESVAEVVGPAGRDAADHLLSLEPFYLRTEGRSTTLPWNPYRDSKSVSMAVKAAKTLASAAKARSGELAAT